MTNNLIGKANKDRDSLLEISNRYKQEIYDLVEEATELNRKRREARLANPNTKTEVKPKVSDPEAKTSEELSEPDSEGKKEMPGTPPAVEQL